MEAAGWQVPSAPSALYLMLLHPLAVLIKHPCRNDFAGQFDVSWLSLLMLSFPVTDGSSESDSDNIWRINVIYSCTRSPFIPPTYLIYLPVCATILSSFRWLTLLMYGASLHQITSQTIESASLLTHVIYKYIIIICRKIFLTNVYFVIYGSVNVRVIRPLFSVTQRRWNGQTFFSDTSHCTDRTTTPTKNNAISVGAQSESAPADHRWG